MAADAILNLLFLLILVKRSISSSSPPHCCKISFIYVNRRPRYCCLCKNPRWRDLIFVQYFDIPACRTSRIIRMPNFVQICAIVNELWAINEIQNGGRRHLEFIIFVHFGQMVYFRWQPSTSLQNFNHLRQSAAELLLFVQKSKMAAAAILNYNFVRLDHPRSPLVHLKFPFKFRVDRVRTFRDIAIRKFRKFGLKCLFRPQKSCFWGVLTPKHYFLSSIPPKRPYLTRKHVLRAINGRDRSSGVTCRRGQEYKKDETQKVTENALPTQTSFPSSHINQILHVRSCPVYLSWLQVLLRLVKKMWDLWGSKFPPPVDLARRLYNSLLLPHKPWSDQKKTPGASNNTLVIW